MLTPTYVDPFLGAGAVWLSLLGEDLVPLVSWMGGKRRLAREILQVLDLRPGRPIPCLLGDASWWGWVWPVCLDPVTGPRVAAILRSWRGEDPRALWFRLRDAGPFDDRAEAAAQLLWLQARAASGVPVWWEGSEVLAAPGAGRVRQFAADRGANGLRLVQHASTKVDDAGQRQATEPSLIQMANGRGPYVASMAGDKLLASDGRGVPREAGHKADKDHGGRTGGIVDPGTIAGRLDAVRARLVKASGGEAGFGYDHSIRAAKGWRQFQTDDVAVRVDAVRRAAPGSLAVLHVGAGALTDEWAPRLGAAGRVYLDPPYQGATGYPATCPRDEVLHIAETWARHGARVVLSEAVGLAAELGGGWSQHQLRRGKKAEWITCYGCEARAALPPILRLAGGAA